MIDKDIVKELFDGAASQYIVMDRFIFLKDKLDEFEYRYNNRNQNSNATFEDLLGRMCYEKYN